MVLSLRVGMKAAAGVIGGAEDRSSVSGMRASERDGARLTGAGPRAIGRSGGPDLIVSEPVSVASVSRRFLDCGRNGLAAAIMTREGAGAGVPVRNVAISIASSLPSIGAFPTYSTRTRA